MMPEPYAMDLLQQLRRKFNKPMRITSAARCPDHNVRVSSTGPSGPHTSGTAFDIAVDRGDAWRLIQLATRDGWQGLGVSQKGVRRFIHIDKARETPTVWSY
jgi:zinc D-Ala-D-Ala carboxypeptidase